MNLKIKEKENALNIEINNFEERLLSKDSYNICKNKILNKINQNNNFNYVYIEKIIELEMQEYFKQIKIILNEEIQKKKKILEEYEKKLEDEFKKNLDDYIYC